MKNNFTLLTFKENKRGVLLMFLLVLLAFLETWAIDKNVTKKEEENRRLLPPPTPTVTVTPPSGANCYSVLTASGCNAGNSVYWYRDNGAYYYNFGATINVSQLAPVFLSAKCYDSSTGTFGTASTEYKIVPANYTEITPNSTQVLCTASSTVLFNASSATSGLSYQWKNYGSNIASATNASYTATASGNYSVQVSSASCTYNSGSVQVTNALTPVISNSFGGSCGSKTLNLNVYNVSGGTFQWKLNNTNISGANSSSYSVAATTFGTYTVEYTFNGCTTTSLPFVYAQPTLTLTPAVSPACDAMLTASGLNCSGFYVYKYNPTTTTWDYASYSSNPYTFPVGTTPSDYRVSCESSYCADVASNTVTAIPTNYTTITPVNPTVCGSSTLLTANSAFTGLSYQWKLNNSDISGANSSTYTATASGDYTVTTTSGACSFTSGISSVNLISPPSPPTSITSNPSTAVNPNTSVSLTASACGSGETFKWEDNSTLNPRTVTSSSTTTYSVKCVQGSCESTTSTSTTVNVLPTITVTSPTPTNICSNNGTSIPVTFTTTGSFTGNFTVMLIKTTSQCNQPQTSTIVSATTATSPVSLVLPTDIAPTSSVSCNVIAYKIEITNTSNLGAITSNSYTVTVNPRPIITVSLSGTCGSQTATFSTQTLPSGTFQWKKDGVNVGTSNTGTSSTYNTAIAGNYTVDYTDNLCTTTSAASSFVQNNAPTIALTPAVSPSCNSTLTATGCTGSVNWYKNTVGTTWVYQGSGNSHTFQVSTNPSDYRATCYLNSCESVLSNVVKATPNNFTEITPSSASICSVGGSILLNASSASSGLSYQWRLSNSNISGANSSTYTATTSGTYSVVVTNGSCSFTSGTVQVSSVTAPTINISSSVNSPATIINGQSLTLTANGCSGGTIAWSTGSTTSSITVTPSSTTNYTFTCTKTPCVVTSSAFVVNVNPLLPPEITSSAESTCSGTSVTLTGTCQSGSTISWNTTPVQTTSVITVSPSVTTNYVATCTAGSVTSNNNITISVFDGVITSLASGDWTTPATWSCNCIPASCNDVIVDSGHTVIIPQNLTGKLQNLTVRGSIDIKNLSTMKMK
ncbi:hypothetical protein LV89_02570 [Arcicella aurantiaca]|uniref:Ig-like domain-containing protein n=1 Tax=Arcicella aurantiaca TaxID=591202 RepID=A0A316EAN8_9BACT|nr:hypothetical protein [Arcicella aurantiaca]PWK26399.1 hypothetical protein LV89_02570 [Arcicella aurantiaca]